MTNEIHELLVSDIVANYSPIYPDGDDWHETVNYLFTQDSEHMRELFEALQNEGIREPITLSQDEDEDKVVLNGTHRVALALHHGLVTLPARYGQKTDGDDEPCLVATVKLKTASTLSEDEDMRMFDVLRSWRLDEHNWITVDVVFGSMGRWEYLLNCRDKKLIPKLKRRILAILKKNFPAYDYSVTVALEEPEEENEDV